jgi:dihydroorotase
MRRPTGAWKYKLREGSFEFFDNYKGTRSGRQQLFRAETVLAGKRLPRA